jgi:S1-C subfamily serine protease
VTIGKKNYLAVPMSNQDEKNPIFFLKITNAVQGETFDAVSFGRSGAEKLAQTVVVLGGTDADAVFKTTLSKLRYAKTDASSTQPLLVAIETIPQIPDNNLGGLVVNLDGQAVGIIIPVIDAAKYVIYPVSRLLELIGGATSAAVEKPVGAAGKTDNVAAVGSAQ